MQSLQTTLAVHAFPQLRRFAFLSPLNQCFITDYLTHLRTRPYALSTQEGALRALTCFAGLMPEARQAILYQDLTPDHTRGYRRLDHRCLPAAVGARDDRDAPPRAAGLLCLPMQPRDPRAFAHSAPTPSDSRADATPEADGGSRGRRVLSGD